jgi:hypothetical protein
MQHQTLPPSQDGLWGCHVTSGSETRLSTKVGSNTTTCTMALDPLRGLRCATCLIDPDPPSLLGGLRAVLCPTVSCEPRASRIKKRLAGLPMQLDPHAPNARARVSKAPRATMGLQDMRAGSAVNACKTCRQTGTWQRYHCIPLA